MHLNQPPIVLIHGLWLTSRCWDSFRRCYEERGREVYAPAWPRLSGEVEDIFRTPLRMSGLGLGEVIEHFDRFIQTLRVKPILIGHSAGGLIAQILLERGRAAAAVSIASPAPRGVCHSHAPAERWCEWTGYNPLDRWRSFPITFRQFYSTFANGMPEVEARAMYERHAIPAPGRVLRQLAQANSFPWSRCRVDFGNSRRAPLLLVAGGEDRFSSPSSVRATYHRYSNSSAVTEYLEFPGRSHLLIAHDGWREVANRILEWADHHRVKDRSGIRSASPHLKGPNRTEPRRQTAGTKVS